MKREDAISLGFDSEGTYHGVPIFFREADHMAAGKNWLCDVLVAVLGAMDRLASYFSGYEMVRCKLTEIKKKGEK